MTKAFSVLSWNVKHFGQRDGSALKTNPDDIVSATVALDPDVVGIYEVVGADIFSVVVSKNPRRHLPITEGPRSQERSWWVRHGLTAFFTKKLECLPQAPLPVTSSTPAVRRPRLRQTGASATRRLRGPQRTPRASGIRIPELYYGGSAPPPCRRRRAWRLAGLAIPGARLGFPRSLEEPLVR